MKATKPSLAGSSRVLCAGITHHRLPRQRAIATSIAVAIAAASAGALLLPLRAYAQPAKPPAEVAAPVVDFDISAGPLGKALDAFTVQSNTDVNFAPQLVAGKSTSGLSGRFVPAAALRMLLRNSGLALVQINQSTFVLKADPPGDPAPVPQATPAQPSASSAPEKPKTLQAISVTGSHIRAAQLATANPVVVVTAQQIQQTGALTIGQVIKDLPSVTGSIVTPNIDNQGNTGLEAVGLRGLGPERTLLLVNGQRIVSNDLGTIPVAAIERIEVMTTGASMVYGSDAIGGVVNVILKSNFQGAQVQVNYGISDHGDGIGKGFSLTFGQTSDKGSIVAGVDYNKTEAIAQINRKFSSQTLSITGSTNTPIHTVLGGSSFSPRSVTFLPKNLKAQFGCPTVSLNASAVGQSEPTTLADFHCTTRADYYSYSVSRPLTQPQERDDAFLNGTYHLSSHVDAFLTVMHNKTSSSFTLGPPVWSNLTGVVLSKDSYYNPFGIDFSPGNGNILESRLTTLGNRVTPVGRTTDNVMLGLRGYATILGHDWQWDIGFDYGHVSAATKAEGLPVLAPLNPGLGPSMLDPATGQVVCVNTPGDLSTAISGCTPWDTFNLENPASLAAVQASGTTATGIFNTYNQQRTKYADISGGIFDLPAGTVQLALGASYRTLYLNQIVGSGLLADPFGLCPLSSQCTSPVRGGYSVKEAYGELFVPLLKDFPGVQSLSLDVGDRYSKYSSFGSTSNTKIGVQYRPIEDVLLRGNVSKVFRAPTIGDIFAGIAFGGTTLNSDPCDHITSPNPACVGVPTDGSFVDTEVASHSQTNTLGSGSALAGFPLGPEQGKSFDFGVVWSPQFVPGRLDASVDVWRIYLNNNITGVSANTVLTACFNGISQFCPLIDRFGPGTANPGQIRQIHAPTANLGRIDVKGLDFNVAYRLPPLSIGQFAVDVHSTYMTQYKQQTAPGLPGNSIYDLVGNINTDLGGGLGILMPRIRAQGQFNWELGPWHAYWQMQFIDHFDVGSPVVSRHYSAVRGFKTPYVLHYGSYVYNDFAVGYSLPSLKTRIDLGVNNVFDKQPPILYYNFYGLGNGATDGANFDVVGRFYWGRVTVTF